MKTLWKVFKADLKSNNGDIEWKLNKWQRHKGKLDICSSGFHASERIIDAMQYTNAELIVKVEVKGKSIIEEDKECWEEMRIIKKWKWNKKKPATISMVTTTPSHNKRRSIHKPIIMYENIGRDATNALI